MSALTKILKHTSPEARSRLFKISGIPLPTVFVDEQPIATVVELTKWIKNNTSVKQQASLSYVVDRIAPMTEELGYQALMSECTTLSTHQLRSISRQELAITLLDEEEKTFQRAEKIRYVNHYREGRAWDGFSLPEPIPYTDNFDQEPLKKELQTLFNTQDAFYIDTFPLRDNWNPESVQWQIMIYREGVDTPYIEVNPDTDSLDTGSHKPAKEYALVYTPARGIIEVISNRQADRRELAFLCAQHILGTEVSLTKLIPRDCSLDPFYTEPTLPFFDDKSVEEDVLWAKVSAVTLTSPTTGMDNTTRCSLRKLPDNHIYQCLADNDLAELLDNGKLHFKTVTLTIAFQASRDGRLPKETISIPISLPNKCGVKPHGVRHRYIRDVLFPRWGIFPS